MNVSSTQSKIISIVGILVGGIATILQLCVAFGVDFTDDQTAAITSVAGLVLLVVSAWFNPSVPFGIRSGA